MGCVAAPLQLMRPRRRFRPRNVAASKRPRGCTTLCGRAALRHALIGSNGRFGYLWTHQIWVIRRRRRCRRSCRRWWPSLTLGFPMSTTRSEGSSLDSMNWIGLARMCNVREPGTSMASGPQTGLSTTPAGRGGTRWNPSCRICAISINSSRRHVPNWPRRRRRRVLFRRIGQVPRVAGCCTGWRACKQCMGLRRRPPGPKPRISRICSEPRQIRIQMRRSASDGMRSSSNVSRRSTQWSTIPSTGYRGAGGLPTN